MCRPLPPPASIAAPFSSCHSSSGTAGPRIQSTFAPAPKCAPASRDAPSIPSATRVSPGTWYILADAAARSIRNALCCVGGDCELPLRKEAIACCCVIPQDAGAVLDIHGLCKALKGESPAEGLQEGLLVDVPARQVPTRRCSCEAQVGPESNRPSAAHPTAPALPTRPETRPM